MRKAFQRLVMTGDKSIQNTLVQSAAANSVLAVEMSMSTPSLNPVSPIKENVAPEVENRISSEKSSIENTLERDLNTLSKSPVTSYKLKGRANKLRPKQASTESNGSHIVSVQARDDSEILKVAPKKRRHIIEDEDEETEKVTRLPEVNAYNQLQQSPVKPNSERRSAKSLRLAHLPSEDDDQLEIHTKEKPIVSIFDQEDEIDDIIEMNAALAQLKTKKVVDPLFGDSNGSQSITGSDINNFDISQDIGKKEPLRDPLELFEKRQQQAAEEDEGDDILYDSDGNPIGGWIYEEENSDTEKPMAELNSPVPGEILNRVI